MCGITGILNLIDREAPSKNELNKMIRTLDHRGPDDHGYYMDNYIGLAHSRLSIIDLQSGHQPIHDVSKRVWIVFNGEIYNYIELRKELINDGYSFYTTSDTEVIVNLYLKYGKKFVNQLNGQFAIALWDKKTNTLILTRDRVGISPLFYTQENGRLLFGSEIKAILSVLKHSPSLSPSSLDQLLTFWSPVVPNTLFKDVFEVKPGEMTIVHKGHIEHERYWEWEYPAHSANEYLQGSAEELAEQLHDKLVTATQIRLRADVPVAAYLSGGLDSSALVSIIHHHSDAPLRTFSIGFEEKRFDESSYQQKLIAHLQADHSSINCRHGDISSIFEKVIWHTESTILRTAPAPMMLLSKLVKDNNYKVVLTGEGADEVFGGYDIFKEGKIRQFWARNKNSTFRPLLLKKLYPYLDITKLTSRSYLEAFFGVGLDNPGLAYFAHLPRWETTAKIKSFYSKSFNNSLSDNAIEKIQSSLHENISKWHPFNQSQYVESRSLMAKYLLSSQGDRMLMANSIEGRFPFLDHNVIEFANKLHPKLKMKVLNEKYLLKMAMKKYLPDEIVNRHKQPYRAPDISSFMHANPPSYISDLLSESEIKNNDYFDSKKVGILLKKIKLGRANGYKDNMAFMAILSTQMLHHLFIKNFADYSWKNQM